MPRLLLVSFAACLALCAAEASKPDFSGNWKMNAARSDFGPLPRPLDYERKIDHNEPIIQMTVRQATAMGEQTINQVLRTDGKEITNKYPNGEAKTVGKWIGRELQFTTTRQVAGGDATTIETWSLSQDGKTLTSVTSMQTPRGAFQIKLVLDKQR